MKIAPFVLCGTMHKKKGGGEQLYEKIVQLKLTAVAKRGGEVAGNARKQIETQTGKPVITQQNAKDFARLIEDIANNHQPKEK